MRIIECKQGSQEWYNVRRGVITGTKLEQAFKQSDSLLDTLIAERMVTLLPETQKTATMEKGNTLEPFARKEYVRQTDIQGCEVGFILHPERDDIGLSPDFIASDFIGAAEFKCPDSKKHIEYMRDKNPPKQYLFQLLAYFLNIPDLDAIDFVSYDELNEVRPLVIKTFELKDLLNFNYLKGKKVESMAKLEDKVFEFADSVHEQYNELVF